MSRFRKLTHTIWHCQYHIVFCPKYRYRILEGEIGLLVEQCIHTYSSQKSCEVIELNVQIDHVHLLVMIPPKISVSSFVGMVKGRTAIRIFNKYRSMKNFPYWGNHFWSEGYCVDTVGLDAEKILKYVKYQEQKERHQESQMKFNV